MRRLSSATTVALLLALVAVNESADTCTSCVSRRALLRLVSALPLAAAEQSAHAWCGEPFPPFAYSLPWFEFDVASNGCAKLPVRIIGDLKTERNKGLRPLLVLPSPGLSYEYLENLEAVAVSERRVAFVDMSGCARSPSELGSATAAVLGALEAPRGAHVLGHGLGAAVALAAYRAAPEKVASLVLASPLGGEKDLEPSTATAAEGLPYALLSSEATRGRVCIDNEKAGLARRQRTAALLSAEYSSSGSLLDALPPDSLPLPLLLTRGGRADISARSTARAICEQLPQAQLRIFEQSGSLPQVDERAAYNSVLLDFMDRVDGVVTRRAAMTPGTLMPAGGV